MRGEYLRPGGTLTLKWELPPRARRILPCFESLFANGGTTSACAENTFETFTSVAQNRNYLRVRGEYFRLSPHTPLPGELPPRARRIRAPWSHGGDTHGTTSACAENTTGSTSINTFGGNYLRVRGEYKKPSTTWIPPWELPPRARRIQPENNAEINDLGTTSACAENTRTEKMCVWVDRNYLRVRGEYVTTLEERLDRMELPPRARRIQPSSRGIIINIGTTSACAENTG